MSRIRASSLLRVLASTLVMALFTPFVPALAPAPADAYVGDTGSHPPPTTGPYAYFATYGAFSPSLSGFPAVGGSFVDPVFGSTVRRLTNELNQYSYSENYGKNGFINADATLMHHRAQTGHNIINTKTGQVVRASVPFNVDSSFAPDDPDVFYWFNPNSTALNKYTVSTGTTSLVKNFSGALGALGGSVDWIDASGRYMVLNLAGSIRVYDVKSDILYAGSIPASYGGNGGWISISPDGNYVIAATDPPAFRSFRIDHTAKSVSTSGVLFWTLCGDHADVVSGSNGKTYLVAFECYSEAAVYAVDVSIPQTTADPAKQRADNKRIIKLASWTDTAGHFSGVSKGALKDWFFFTIESGDDTFTAPVTSAWRPYMQELIMANVLTGEIRRLAHHRSRSTTTNYFYTPRPSASWDGSLVTWVSNFGHSSNGYVDLYAIDVAGASNDPAPTPTDPAPAPSTLSLAFTNPASGATVSGTATVTVGATGGSGSGYTYTVKAGTATVYSGTNSTFSWNTTTSTNGSVTLNATVTDSAQATASDTRTVTVSNTTGGDTPPVGADTTAPTATITSPKSKAWTGAGLNIKVSATDDKQLSKIELWAAGQIFATIPCSGATCSGATWWNSGALAPAAYQINAVAQDAAGNRTVSSAVTIFKDAKTPLIASGATGGSATPTSPTSPLAVAFTSPAAGATVSGTAAFAVAVTGATGALTVAPSVDGTALPAQTVSGTTANFTVNTTSLSNGSHTVAVKVTDGAATTANASLAVTVGNTTTTPTSPPSSGDTTAPTATLTSPTSGVWTGAGLTIAASATDNVALSKIELWAAGNIFATLPCSGTSCTGSSWWNSGVLPAGAYEINAVAQDAAGNRTVSARIVIYKDARVPVVASGATGGTTTPTTTTPTSSTDTTLPTAAITSPPSGVWTGAGLTIAAAATDNATLSKIELWANGAVFASLPCAGTSCAGSSWWNSSALPTGGYQIQAVAVDAAGNRTVSSAVTIYKDATAPTYSAGAR